MTNFERPLSAREFSQWLDCFRWISAWTVLISHIGGILLIPLSRLPTEFHSLPQAAYSFVAGFSHYAVMIFFVMSGYLVGGSFIGSPSRSRQTFKEYIAKRTVRLGTVLIPTLLITSVLAWSVSHTWGIVAIESFGHKDGLLSIQTAVCNSIFMQDVMCRQYGANASLWSLTHEFWYYIAFPLVATPILRSASPLSVALAVLAILWLITLSIMQFHPVSIGIYSAVWLLGAVIATMKPIRSLRKLNFFISILLFLAFTATLRTMKVTVGEDIMSNPIFDFLVAAAFAFLLTTMKSTPNLPSPPMQKIHAHLAKFSFSLYCIHFPVALTYSAVGIYIFSVPTEPAPVDLFRWIYVGGGILVCLASAYIMYLTTEKHTDYIRSIVFPSLSSASKADNKASAYD